MITSLKPNQVFVFGSNAQGEHFGGAAKQAYDDFHAQWGVAVGRTGQCYAIPTVGVSEFVMCAYIEQFKEYARLTPDTEYLLTAIGTGIAGHTEEYMDEYLRGLPSNVIRV